MPRRSHGQTEMLIEFNCSMNKTVFVEPNFMEGHNSSYPNSMRNETEL